MVTARYELNICVNFGKNHLVMLLHFSTFLYSPIEYINIYIMCIIIFVMYIKEEIGIFLEMQQHNGMIFTKPVTGN